MKALHVIFTWLDATASIVATFKRPTIDCKTKDLKINSEYQIMVGITSTFETKAVNFMALNQVYMLHSPHVEYL